MENNDALHEKVSSLFYSKLNESQTKAVKSCLRMMECDHRSIELIWGPSGTGKTKTVCSLLITLLRMNLSILACAPSNTAVKEMASRVLMLAKESFEIDSGNNSFCSFGDILLFGNFNILRSRVVEAFLLNLVLSSLDMLDRYTHDLIVIFVGVPILNTFINEIHKSVEVCFTLSRTNQQIYRRSEESNSFNTIFDEINQRFERIEVDAVMPNEDLCKLADDLSLVKKFLATHTSFSDINKSCDNFVVEKKNNYAKNSMVISASQMTTTNNEIGRNYDAARFIVNLVLTMKDDIEQAKVHAEQAKMAVEQVRVEASEDRLEFSLTLKKKNRWTIFAI